ncbi:MAG: hypothetical protein HC898_12630 [Phycisphaerales bacterium]|nr:hypothetical protein [Phycisphaerales bacterium]
MEEANKERQRIKELEGKSIDRLAPRQEELAQKTGELNQRQAQSGQGPNGQAPGGGAGEDSGSAGQAGGDSPGKAAADQAQQAMKQAGASLRRKEQLRPSRHRPRHASCWKMPATKWKNGSSSYASRPWKNDWRDWRNVLNKCSSGSDW